MCVCVDRRTPPNSRTFATRSHASARFEGADSRRFVRARPPTVMQWLVACARPARALLRACSPCGMVSAPSLATPRGPGPWHPPAPALTTRRCTPVLASHMDDGRVGTLELPATVSHEVSLTLRMFIVKCPLESSAMSAARRQGSFFVVSATAQSGLAADPPPRPFPTSPCPRQHFTQKKLLEVAQAQSDFLLCAVTCAVHSECLFCPGSG
jgi:hypothetical protein|mmetsp:Transcript_16057/g.28099  ORF Transcript_16057/g.28099 Transcript_16057/m.28099 type:complete len:211 (+) Transcript_16057:138-770(+)